jgi:hypothetical protein
MRCDELEDRIHQCLDRRISPRLEEALRDHAQNCGRCRETLSTYEQLLDGLHFFEEPPISEDFTQNVISQASVPRPRRRWLVTGLVVSAIAASLLLAFLLRFSSSPGSPEIASPNPVAPTDQDLAVANPISAPDGTPHQIEEGNYHEKGVSVSRVNLIWGELAARWNVDQWEPVDRLSGGFAPITTPLSVAIDEIRSTIPLGRSSSGKEPQSDSADTSWSVLQLDHTV